MQATKRLIKINNNYYFPVTKDVAEYLEINDENKDVIWQDEEGKHGKFVSFWVKKED